uniref:Uncharacterized protein n=1 Tax=Anguilla anguilla TaxID=7936 RepID=A0A0E9PA10_ANGAN
MPFYTEGSLPQSHHPLGSLTFHPSGIILYLQHTSM